ncbi:response regulator [Geitlerinema sp. PCC 9228]|uniref:response regulator n=1 Tax=Geitlerinema sp. PCC 9228 TaxID=111611 RepID=UPI0008F9A165|nr:response regulator [Geitlerinema sp. PCC 9228]
MAAHKILVIDDSRVIQKMVKEMLPPGNFEVLQAKDGEEGLRLIREGHPNLIMLDFLLPKVNGWEVYQQIQADPHLRSIPLVLMSGRKEEVVEKIPEPFEYFEFIEKPFEKKALINAIKSAMAKAKKRPAAKQPAQKQAEAPAPAPAASAQGSDQQVQELQQKVAKLEKEVATLKKQLSQMMTFIKQKLK